MCWLGLFYLEIENVIKLVCDLENDSCKKVGEYFGFFSWNYLLGKIVLVIVLFNVL